MFGSLVRGGQVTVHGWRMATQLVKIIINIILLVVLFSAVFHVWQFAKREPFQMVMAVTYAKTKTLYAFRDDDARIPWAYRGGQGGTIDIGAVRGHSQFKIAADNVLNAGGTGALRGGWGSGVIVLLTVVLFWFRGRKVVEKRHIKGSRMLSAKKLRSLIIEEGRGGNYSIADIPWFDGDENLHTLIVGTTGSGKTVTISDILEQIKNNGDKAIVFDKLGSFIPYFYEPEHDFILNPFDERGADWCLFSEAESAVDFNSMAVALIPEFKDTADPFWTSAARMLFATSASTMWKQNDFDMAKLINLLVKTDLSVLANLMKDTEIQSIIDPKNPKTSLSVRSMLTTFIQPLTLLNPVRKPFSIRQWVQDDKKQGFLFLSSKASTHEVRRSQIATQIELAITALLSLPRDPKRRVWIIIDELPALHKIPSLVSGLREIRQFGGCIVLGTQVFSEIKDLYGREAALSISGNCNTRLCLASPDRDTAVWMSDNFGKSITHRMNEGFSYGADTIRDGVSHTMREDLQPTVLPSDLMTLPPLEGYLKLPFDLPVAKVKLTPKTRPVLVEKATSEQEASGQEKTDIPRNISMIEAPNDETEDDNEEWDGQSPSGPKPPEVETIETKKSSRSKKKAKSDKQIEIPLDEGSLKGQSGEANSPVEESAEAKTTKKSSAKAKSAKKSSKAKKNNGVIEIMEEHHPHAHESNRPIITSADIDEPMKETDHHSSINSRDF
jgi:type IV conjugative transfer system coupling protein TraD